jgi:hypothetical protein
MAKFFAVYTGKPGAAAPAQADVARGIQAWSEWMGRHADRIVDAGGPLGKTKKISAAGIADTQNNLGGYVIVEADDHEAAARMFEGHPHFSIFPGDGVEVMACLPVPTA